MRPHVITIRLSTEELEGLDALADQTSVESDSLVTRTDVFRALLSKQLKLARTRGKVSLLTTALQKLRKASE